jgi:hypothetical protein
MIGIIGIGKLRVSAFEAVLRPNHLDLRTVCHKSVSQGGITLLDPESV